MIEQHQATFEPDFLSEIWRYPLGGGSGTKVSGSSASSGTGDEVASYSPDGTKIVFDRLPSEQIMTADLDGSNAFRWALPRVPTPTGRATSTTAPIRALPR
jgi:Tol biopolymer transport system component